MHSENANMVRKYHNTAKPYSRSVWIVFVDVTQQAKAGFIYKASDFSFIFT